MKSLRTAAPVGVVFGVDLSTAPRFPASDGAEIPLISSSTYPDALKRENGRKRPSLSQASVKARVAPVPCIVLP